MSNSSEEVPEPERNSIFFSFSCTIAINEIGHSYYQVVGKVTQKGQVEPRSSETIKLKLLKLSMCKAMDVMSDTQR